MEWNEMREVVEKAKDVIFKADCYVSEMASLCQGKLRSSGVGKSVLSALKKELKDYNIHTRQWREK